VQVPQHRTGPGGVGIEGRETASHFVTLGARIDRGLRAVFEALDASVRLTNGPTVTVIEEERQR
jgi:hypothetical protein